KVRKDRKENVMLISFISGKSLVAASLFLTGGLGTVAIVHANAHARIEATDVTANTSQSASSTQNQSTTNQSTSGTTSATINQGLASGASIHGLCVAYKAHMMASGGASAGVMTQLAHSKAFVELADLATAKSETVTTFCAAQAGVSMTAIPNGHANATAHHAVKVHNPIVASNNSSASIALKNRP
ncbi:hypothetical protein, partial [Ferrimicrobium acidiphilum]